MSAVAESNAAESILQEYLREHALRQPPSSRNEKIFQAVRVDGRRLAEVAKENNLSEQRVSQIVARVAQWRRWNDGSADAVAAHDRHRPSADELDRQRADAIYLRSIRAFDDGDRGRTVQTVRTRETAHGPMQDTTTRETGPNAQHLKAALRALECKGKLADRPLPEQDSLENRVRSGLAAIAELRTHAERAGIAARGRSALDLVYRLLGQLLTSTPEELMSAWKWEEEGGGTGDRGQESGDGGRESGDRGRESGDRGRESGDRGRGNAVRSGEPSTTKHGQDARGTRRNACGTPPEDSGSSREAESLNVEVRAKVVAASGVAAKGCGERVRRSREFNGAEKNLASGTMGGTGILPVEEGGTGILPVLSAAVARGAQLKCAGVSDPRTTEHGQDARGTTTRSATKHGQDARGTQSEHGQDARGTQSEHGQDARGTQKRSTKEHGQDARGTQSEHGQDARGTQRIARGTRRRKGWELGSSERKRDIFAGKRLARELRDRHEAEQRAERPQVFATPFVCPPPGWCPVLLPGEQPPCEVCPSGGGDRGQESGVGSRESVLSTEY